MKLSAKKGMSLIAVLIAAGLLSIIMLSLARLFEVSSKAKKGLSESYEFDNLHQASELVLRSDQQCDCVFKGQSLTFPDPPPANQEVNLPAFKVYSDTSTSPCSGDEKTLVATGQNYQGFTVDRMFLKDLIQSGSSNTYFATLVIEGKKSDAALGSLLRRERELMLVTSTDGTNVTIESCGPDPSSSIPSQVLTVHSYSTAVPDCPSGWSSLWTGYSFVGSTPEGSHGGENDQGGGFQAVDLGGPGACLNGFSKLPFIEGDKDGNLNHNTGHDRAQWLAISGMSHRPTTSNTSLIRDNWISRCRVCRNKVPSILVVHNFWDTTTPTCPTGYESTPLWTGHTLMSTRTGDREDANQDLSQVGSCSNRGSVTELPIVECRNASPPDCEYISGGDFYTIGRTSVTTRSRCAVCVESTEP